MLASVSATCSCVQGDGCPVLLRKCFEMIGSCCLCTQVFYSAFCIFLGWRLANDAKELGYGSAGASDLVRSMGIATALNWVYDVPISLLSYSWARYKEQNKLDLEKTELRTNDGGDVDLEQAPHQIAVSRV